MVSTILHQARPLDFLQIISYLHSKTQPWFTWASSYLHTHSRFQTADAGLRETTNQHEAPQSQPQPRMHYWMPRSVGRTPEKQDICITSSISRQIVPKCCCNSNVCPHIPLPCLQEVEPHAVTPTNRTWRRKQTPWVYAPFASEVASTTHLQSWFSVCWTLLREKGCLHFWGFLPPAQTLVQREDSRHIQTVGCLKTSDQHCPTLSGSSKTEGVSWEIMTNQRKPNDWTPVMSGLVSGTSKEHQWGSDVVLGLQFRALDQR